MNCNHLEERIALYAGGDLAPAEAQAVERHVAECTGCQLLLSGLRESLRVLREAHADPVEEAHLAAVRARVFARIESRHGSLRRWGWAYAMAVAAAVLLIAVWPRPLRTLILPMPLAPAAPAVAKLVPVHGAKPPGKVLAKAQKPPAEPLVVKLLTDDPDVVIYWITSTKGE